MTTFTYSILWSWVMVIVAIRVLVCYVHHDKNSVFGVNLKVLLCYFVYYFMSQDLSELILCTYMCVQCNLNCIYDNEQY